MGGIALPHVLHCCLDVTSPELIPTWSDEAMGISGRDESPVFLPTFPLFSLSVSPSN